MFERLRTKLFDEITTIPESLIPNRLPGMDGLRGVSIMLVIINHLVGRTIYQDYFIGFMGVQAFLVMSGFLITTLLLKEKFKTGEISLRQFYIRRCLRILPVAWLFVFTLTILNAYLKLQISNLSLISCLLFIQNIPYHHFYNFYLRHMWTVSVEEQFYFTFPFLIAYSVTKYIKIIIAFMAFIILISYLGYTNTGIFYSNHIVHIITFIFINLWGSTVAILIGSLLSILVFKGIVKIKDTKFNRYLSLIILIVAILIRLTYSWFFIPNSEIFLYPSLIGLVIILNLNPKSILTKVLSNKVLVHLGILSYSLYIWQSLFTDQIMWLIKVNSITLHLVLLFIVANASYYLYEKPFLNLKEKFQKVKTI